MPEIGETSVLPGKEKISLPQIKPIRLGEYGRALEKVWEEFATVRNDGCYAADQNREKPRFSEAFGLHGLTGKYVGKRYVDLTFLAPFFSTVRDISHIGVLSSDVEFEGSNREASTEEETYGTADFWTPNKHFDSMPEFLIDLRRGLQKGIGKKFVTATDESVGSSTIMFAFDTSRTGLQPLMRYAMKDTQPKEARWAQQFGEYVNFPRIEPGTHLAVPIGLPANYIEYLVINEKSSYWQEDRLDQLRQSAVCDGHQIPLISIHTNTVV